MYPLQASGLKYPPPPTNHGIRNHRRQIKYLTSKTPHPRVEKDVQNFKLTVQMFEISIILQS